MCRTGKKIKENKSPCREIKFGLGERIQRDVWMDWFEVEV
jgi:hypothetical protein